MSDQAGDVSLLADVGGTNTRVGLGDAHGLRPGSAQCFANDDFTGLAPILRTYLDGVDIHPSTVCAGVAGPVAQGRARLTNRGWLIDAGALTRATGADRAQLINDLQAQGYALDDLEVDQVSLLFEGTGPTPGTRLVMGLGTGCNIAVVHDIGGRLFVPPAEAGHSGLPHVPGLEDAMAQLADAQGHLPVEGFLSGPGLVRLHHALTGERSDAPQIIADAPETMAAFARLLGHVAGNFALIHMALGGLYLIGGLARAVAPHLSQGGFRACFEARGPYRHILEAIPVFLIEDDDAALRGCARFLRQGQG